MHFVAPHIFTTPFFWTAAKWLTITLIWGILAYGIYREGKLVRHWQQRRLDLTEMASFLHLMHQRNMQIVLLLFLLLAMGATVEIREDMPSQSLQAAPAESSKAAADDISAIIEKGPPKNPASQSMPFSDIAELGDKDGKRQAYLDWLKERYETWLVSYYYLQRCGKVEPKDLDQIRGALEKDLNAVHGEAAIQDNILLAANGSYNEMYRDIPCDKKYLATTKATYDANMQQIGRVWEPPAEPKPQDSEK